MTKWNWEPKEDITVYELAAALSVLLPATGGGASAKDIDEMVRKLSPSVVRHFRAEAV